MRDTIDILYLEDDSSDLQLVCSYLAAEGMDCRLVPVSARSDFEAALDHQSWSLIVADFHLPTHKALEAMQIARHKCPSVPLLMISGVREFKGLLESFGLETVDCIGKDQLSRLGSAIRAALSGQQDYRGGGERRTQTTSTMDARFQSLLQHTSDIVFVLGLDLKVLSWNLRAEQATGWKRPEVLHRELQEFLPTSQENTLQICRQKTLEQGQWQEELHIQDRNRRMQRWTSKWILVNNPPGHPDAFLVINSETGLAQRIEEQLLRAQRMDSIGALAGGVAHDLNNVLSPILMSLNLLNDQCVSEEGRQLLRTLESSAQRGAEIVQQMLSFARGSSTNRAAVDVGLLIRKSVNIFRETFPKNIRIAVEVPESLGSVWGNMTQLHQVLMNLCVNARDAMPEGGTLMISADRTEVDECYARSVEGARVGTHIRLTVNDTGMGMPPEVLSRIFEPFFTTKGPDQGTGLGLSTVLGIVRDHQGFLKVESHPGSGTRFEICFPLHDPEGKALEESCDDEVPFGQGELVLVIDDEESIRQVVANALRKHGYRVLVAEEGARAVDLYARHAGEIQCVITDIAMPGMDGEMSIRAIRRLNPDTRFIVSSGQGPRRDAQTMANLGVNDLLPKPYRAEELLRTLHRVLHA
ncbi:MAG TPA: response regulator [Candidatus Paceibacterota bacterium]|nr:response regulator [Verrucomicrobiota bacterium]HRY48807.1 response regulator [Candidatus Paceibacterota bacterium]HSA00379.1 response regulator [Candidatus Paceibacterota bacterium]